MEVRRGGRAAIGAAGLIAVVVLLRLNWPEQSGRAPSPQPLAAPDAQPIAAPAPAPPSEPNAGVAIVGRVVDERRFPVPGAVATIVGPAGAMVSSALADGRGRFRIPGIRAPFEPLTNQVGIHVRAPDGRAGAAVVLVPSGVAGEVDAGVVVVKTGQGLLVCAVAGGGPVAGAEVIASIAQAPVATATTGADGRAVLGPLPEAEYRLLARTESLLGRRTVRASPWRTGIAEIELRPVRDVEVLVVASADGAPIAGAAVRVQGREMRGASGGIFEYELREAVPLTDGSGRTFLRGVGREDLLLQVRAPGCGVGEARVPGAEAQVRVELSARRTIRWPIVAGAAPVPADGTPVVIRPAFVEVSLDPTPLPPDTARIEGGALFLDVAPEERRRWIARSADESLAGLLVPPGTEGKEIAFGPARRLTVVVRDEDGTAVDGVTIGIFDERDRPLAPPAGTDTEGRVVFEGLAAERIVPGEASRRGLASLVQRLGAADLTGGDRTIEATMGRPREVTIRLRLDGVPGLPPEFSVRIAGSGSEIVEEDPEGGVIVVRHRFLPRAKLARIVVEAPGYLPAFDDLIVAAAGALETTIDLKRAAEVRLDVRPPADEFMRFVLLRPAAPDALPVGIDAYGAPRHVEPGEWRLEERFTGVRWPAFTAAAGEVLLIPIDLSKGGLASGRVEAPAGTKLQDVRLLVDGGEGFPDAPGVFSARVDADGTFRVRVPGDRPVRIRPWHPTLAAAPGGDAEVETPRDGVLLRLQPVGGARFTFAGAPPAGPVHALLYRGEAVGPPTSRHPVAFAGGAGSFGGVPPGRFTVWLDLGSGAPVVLGPLDFGGEVLDLGELRPPPGARLRVRFDPREDRDRSDPIDVVAERTAKPSLVRWTRLDENGEGVVTGLTPGEWRVRVRARGVLAERTVEIDGRNGEMVVDLTR